MAEGKTIFSLNLDSSYIDVDSIALFKREDFVSYKKMGTWLRNKLLLEKQQEGGDTSTAEENDQEEDEEEKKEDGERHHRESSSSPSASSSSSVAAATYPSLPSLSYSGSMLKLSRVQTGPLAERDQQPQLFVEKSHPESTDERRREAIKKLMIQQPDGDNMLKVDLARLIMASKAGTMDEERPHIYRCYLLGHWDPLHTGLVATYMRLDALRKTSSAVQCKVKRRWLFGLIDVASINMSRNISDKRLLEVVGEFIDGLAEHQSLQTDFVSSFCTDLECTQEIFHADQVVHCCSPDSICELYYY